VNSARCNIQTDPTEPIKTAEKIWKDLDLYVRERALRLLSDLCYAYVTKQIGDAFSERETKENSPQSLESNSG